MSSGGSCPGGNCPGGDCPGGGSPVTILISSLICSEELSHIFYLQRMSVKDWSFSAVQMVPVCPAMFSVTLWMTAGMAVMNWTAVSHHNHNLEDDILKLDYS